MVIIIIGFSLLGTSFAKKIEPEDFVSYMDSKGCKVEKSSEFENGDFYTTDNTCPYQVEYYLANEEGGLDRKYSDLRIMISYEHRHDEYVATSQSNYQEIVSTYNKYQAAFLYKDSLLYVTADSEFAEEAMEMRKHFGYVRVGINPAALTCFLTGIICLLCLLLAGWWKLNKKLGRAGWIALVPIYNIVCLCEDVLGKRWYAILFFIPLAMFVAYIGLIYTLSKKFNKNTLSFAFSIFFPFILFASVGFED